MKSNTVFSYENRLLCILFFTFGFVFFDRLALNFLFPQIAEEFDLTYKHLGMLASALAITWSFSGAAFGWLSDKLGVRKPLLIISVLVFSAASFISGLAAGFISLLLCRFFMGLAEGPVLPLSQALLVSESTESRMGLNMGLVQSTSAGLLGIVLGGPIVIYLGSELGWRWAFYISFIPGFILALLIWKFVREPKKEEPEEIRASSLSDDDLKVTDILKYRNIILSILISCFFVTWFIVITTFLPTFLTDAKGFSPDQLSFLLLALGLTHVFWGFAVPGLSDKIGRKPAMIVFSALSIFAPLAMIYVDSIWTMAAIIAVTYTGLGCFVLFMAVIPSETVPKIYLATSLGLVMGIGELFGGFIGPNVAGFAADAFGAAAPFWISASCALIATVLSLFLIETAPVKIKVL